MTESITGIMGMVRSCKDQVLGMLKPAIDCAEPGLDMFRPVCGPLVDFVKNVLQAIETL